ncbi:MAG: RNA polymerase sigma factor [Rhodobacteraceae bacterium]|nr:RNA polymerase sigma factor [Paracoccaceae bacterium]
MTRDPRDELVNHIPALRAFALGLTRNASNADDMVQDTIVKAWTRIDTFKAGSNLRSWLFTILRNTYYSDFRKKRREISDSDGTLAGQLSQKPDHDGRLNLADFECAFNTLPAEQREALFLVGALGESYESAAETIGIAVGTVKSRTNRARARIAGILGISSADTMELTDQATMGVVSRQARILG